MSIHIVLGRKLCFRLIFVFVIFFCVEVSAGIEKDILYDLAKEVRLNNKGGIIELNDAIDAAVDFWIKVAQEGQKKGHVFFQLPLNETNFLRSVFEAFVLNNKICDVEDFWEYLKKPLKVDSCLEDDQLFRGSLSSLFILGAMSSRFRSPELVDEVVSDARGKLECDVLQECLKEIELEYWRKHSAVSAMHSKPVQIELGAVHKINSPGSLTLEQLFVMPNCSAQAVFRELQTNYHGFLVFLEILYETAQYRRVDLDKLDYVLNQNLFFSASPRENEMNRLRMLLSTGLGTLVDPAASHPMAMLRQSMICLPANFSERHSQSTEVTAPGPLNVLDSQGREVLNSKGENVHKPKTVYKLPDYVTDREAVLHIDQLSVLSQYVQYPEKNNVSDASFIFDNPCFEVPVEFGLSSWSRAYYVSGSENIYFQMIAAYQFVLRLAKKEGRHFFQNGRLLSGFLLTLNDEEKLSCVVYMIDCTNDVRSRCSCMFGDMVNISCEDGWHPVVDLGRQLSFNGFSIYTAYNQCLLGAFLNNFQKKNASVYVGGEYRNADHFCYVSSCSMRRDLYQDFEIYPMPPLHWVQVPQPNGSTVREKIIEKEIEVCEKDKSTAKLIFLNSLNPEMLKVKVDDGEEINFFCNTSMRDNIERVVFQNAGKYVVADDKGWECVKFNEKVDLMVRRELPLPRNEEDLQQNISSAMVKVPFIMEEKVIVSPFQTIETNDRAGQSNASGDKNTYLKLKNHVHSGFYQPGYVAFSADDTLGVVGKQSILPESIPGSKVLRDNGGNGVVFEFEKSGKKYVAKKTSLRFKELNVSCQLDHCNLLSLKMLLMGHAQSEYPKRRLVYLFYDRLKGDLRQLVGSFQKYSFDVLNDRYQYEPLLMSAVYENILRFVYQIASGLEYMHQRQMVHRDVKPTNILVHMTCSCPNPLVCVCSQSPPVFKVADFDAAFILTDDGAFPSGKQQRYRMRFGCDGEENEEGGKGEMSLYTLPPVGTKGFKSPEGYCHIIGNHVECMPADMKKMDVWSLGVVMSIVLANMGDSLPREAAHYTVPLLFARTASANPLTSEQVRRLTSGGVENLYIPKENNPDQSFYAALPHPASKDLEKWLPLNTLKTSAGGRYPQLTGLVCEMLNPDPVGRPNMSDIIKKIRELRPVLAICRGDSQDRCGNDPCVSHNSGRRCQPFLTADCIPPESFDAVEPSGKTSSVDEFECPESEMTISPCQDDLYPLLEKRLETFDLTPVSPALFSIQNRDIPGLISSVAFVTGYDKKVISSLMFDYLQQCVQLASIDEDVRVYEYTLSLLNGSREFAADSSILISAVSVITHILIRPVVLYVWENDGFQRHLFDPADADADVVPECSDTMINLILYENMFIPAIPFRML